MIFFFILAGLSFLAVIVQEMLPELPWLYGARVLIMPIIFFYGALALPFAGMLALAFFCGFIWDALTVQVVDSAVEISLGWSILLYATLGAVMSGFRPMFQRGRWEIHCLMSGLFTSTIVMAEYLMITFRRGEFAFPEEVWWRVGGSGVVAIILAPLVFFGLRWIGMSVGYGAPQPVEETA